MIRNFLLILCFCAALSTSISNNLILAANLNNKKLKTNKQKFTIEQHLTPKFLLTTKSTPLINTKLPGTKFLTIKNGGRCSAQEPYIKALMPQDNYGLTLKEHPTVHLYIPNTSAKRVLISFQDETKTYSENALLPIQNQKNIASFTLPSDRSPLEIGKNYQWFITVICDDYMHPNDPKFSGWVQRVKPTAEIEQHLANRNHPEKLQWYADNGYWYDLLESLPSHSNWWRHILKYTNHDSEKAKLSP